MADAVIGSAYLQVIPKMDTSGLGSTGSDAGGILGDALQGGMLSKFMGFATKLAAVLGAVEVGKQLYDLGQQAFDTYADFEQLSGGVTKLFGDDAAKSVAANAENAFKTAGMSANEYMETVTSFSASLIKSLDGDTAKAAELSDKAIRDMADNANTFGTDMETLQRAYQSFARDNYSMLDSLSLGYSGTKEGMQQLLADAEAISGVHYDISNYSDIIEAIHTIQEEQHIAGTTAAEAADTVSGSFASLGAAWTNFLGELGKEDADIDAVAQNLADTLVNASRNAFALIGRIAQNAIKSIPKLFTTFAASILKAIGWDKFAADTMKAWTNVRAKIDSALNAIKSAVVDKFNAAKTAALNLWNGIRDGISNAINSARNIVSGVVSNIAGIVSSVFGAVRNTVSSIWNGITSAVSNAVNAVRNTIGSVLGGISGTVSGIFNAVKSAISGPLETAKNVVSNIVGAIKGFFNFSISWPHIPVPYFYINPPGWTIGDLLKGSIPSLGVGWHATGGIIENAELIGVGEKGTELIWPAYDPYLSKYAKAIADNMPNGMGGITVNINGARINDDAEIERCTYQLLYALERKGRM